MRSILGEVPSGMEDTVRFPLELDAGVEWEPLILKGVVVPSSVEEELLLDSSFPSLSKPNTDTSSRKSFSLQSPALEPGVSEN